MTTKDLILKKLDIAPESLLREILHLLETHTPITPRQWSPHFFERTAGAWQGDPLVRPPQDTQPDRPLFE